MFRKLLLAITIVTAALLPLSTPFAATNADCVEIGLTGGWFVVVPDNRSYASHATANNDSLTSLNGSVDQVEPKYKFGGGVNISYQPCGQPYIWNFSWFGVTRNSTTDSDGPVVIGRRPIPSGAFGNVTSAQAASTLNTRYQFATFTLGSLQSVCCDTIHIRPHAGVAYLNEKERQTTYYTRINTGNPVFTSLNTVIDNSKFHGIGPTIGADVKYCFCGGFSLLAGLDYSALIGKQKGYYNLLFPPTATLSGSTLASFNNSRANAFVSHVQSEIGLGYNFGFCGCDRGDLILGWRFVRMFNVSRRLTFNISNFNDQLSGAIVQGPFLRLNLGFNL